MLKGKVKEITIKTFSPSNLFPKIMDLVKLLYDTYQVDINLFDTKHESLDQVEIQVIKKAPDASITDLYVALVLMARVCEARMFIGEEYFDKDTSKGHILELLRKLQ